MSTSRSSPTNVWLWLFQRVSAVLLIIILGVHLWLSNFGQPSASLRTILDGLRNPFWYVDRTALAVDLLMLGIIAFHGMNGIRIVLFDTGIGVGLRSHKIIFWILIALGVLASGLVIFYGLPLLGGT